jgi:hypothetical protein
MSSHTTSFGWRPRLADKMPLPSALPSHVRPSPKGNLEVDEVVRRRAPITPEPRVRVELDQTFRDRKVLPRQLVLVAEDERVDVAGALEQVPEHEGVIKDGALQVHPRRKHAKPVVRLRLHRPGTVHIAERERAQPSVRHPEALAVK